MNKDFSSATRFVEEFFKLTPDVSGTIDIVLFPPYPLIHPIVEAIRQVPRWSDFIEVGAQDFHPAERGAFTGAVSALCLKSVGASWVIIGHSERRNIFGDDDTIVNAKLKAAIGYNLKPVLCVGEPLPVRDSGGQEAHVLSQLDNAFKDIAPSAVDQMTIAYEPIWAIGTGRNATLNEISPVFGSIRRWADKTGIGGGGESIRVLYGGSVTQENARELVSLNDVDGFLVGGASLDASAFARILSAMVSVK